MEYLDCVVKESLRLFPLDRSIIIRECYRSCTIIGVFFPAYTEVVLSTMLQDRDPSVWPDVLKFDPERYLKNHLYVFMYVHMYISSPPRGFSEPVHKYIQVSQLRVLESPAGAAHILRCNLQPISPKVPSVEGTDRPRHRDHYPTLYEECVGSFKFLNRRIERLDLRFNVLIHF